MRKPSGDRNGSRGPFRRLVRREVVALLLAGLLLLLVTAAALAVTGDLTQPAGPGGCINETGAEACADGHGLLALSSVAVSPDGKSVYVASGADGGTVVRLNRDTTTGAITQPAGSAGCVSATGAGPCASGRGIDSAFGVAVSPDGKSVYVAAGGSPSSGGSVARFNRNTTGGAITQPSGALGCVSETGAGTCADGHGLDTAIAVAVSPDGKSVYVASGGSQSTLGSVARFKRNTTGGAINQPAGTAGCISETGSGPCANGHGLVGPNSVALSPDGKSVYVTSGGKDAVVRLNRNTTTGAITQPATTAGCVSETGSGICADGNGLDGAHSVAVSPDGKSVYVASLSSHAVAHLDRNTTGAITQPSGTAGCVSQGGAEGCANGHALVEAQGVAVSPDGKSVYAASADSDAVVRLDRDTITGDVTQPPGISGCVSQTGAGPCANGHGLNFAFSVAVSPDGKSVYVASAGSGGSSGSRAVSRFIRAP
jgi:DNA-binding beta-propeller fold protein YncE